MTETELNTIVDTLLGHVDHAFSALRDRVEALERRKDYDQRPAVRFRGGWRDGETYRAGECVVNKGSLWIAEQDTTPSDIPGVYDSDDQHGPWRLAAKRGKDGSPGRMPDNLERRIRALEQRL